MTHQSFKCSDSQYRQHFSPRNLSNKCETQLIFKNDLLLKELLTREGLFIVGAKAVNVVSES